jgi:hypothetical protein
LVAIAVAIAFWDVSAAAFVHCSRTSTHAAFVKLGAASIVEGCVRVVIARRCVGATHGFIHVAKAVSIVVGLAGSTANAQGIKLIAIAIAVALWNVDAAAFVNLSWAVAHATGIEFPNAGVYIVADAIAVLVSGAITPAFTHHVKLVAVAVAISLGDVRASAFVDGAWSVANATCIDKSEALFLDVADAVFVHVLLAETTTHTDRVKLVAIAVAISGRDAVATANAAFVKDVAVAVAVSFWDV